MSETISKKIGTQGSGRGAQRSAALTVALAALANHAQAALKINADAKTVGPSFDVAIGWDPLGDSTQATSGGLGDQMFVFYGCFGSMNFASSSNAATLGSYAEIGFADSPPLTEGAIVDANLAWNDFSPGGNFLTSAGNFNDNYTSGETFFLGFRFREDGAGASDYHYGYAQIVGEYPDTNMTLTIEGFAWNETPNEAISVAVVPEPAQFVLVMGLVAVGWITGLRRFGLSRRKA